MSLNLSHFHPFQSLCQRGNELGRQAKLSFNINWLNCQTYCLKFKSVYLSLNNIYALKKYFTINWHVYKTIILF